MTQKFIVPELGTKFTNNFSVILSDYIYNTWPYSGLTGQEEGLNKPSNATGQSNYIEFRPGFKREFQKLQVLCSQGRTVVVNHMQTGWKRDAMTTQVWVTTVAQIIGMDDTGSVLRKMDEAIQDVCGMYSQDGQTGDMAGIKDLIYEGSDRIYGPRDNFDKSDWETRHSILMFYELQRVDQ